MFAPQSRTLPRKQFLFLMLVLCLLHSGCSRASSLVTGSTSNPTNPIVTPAARSALTPSTTTLNFSNVNVGGNSTLILNLTNSGNSNITVSNIVISGPSFTISGAGSGQIITPGQMVALNVMFAPAANGSVSGRVTVSSNAANSPVTIALSGTGIQVVVSHWVDLSWAEAASVVTGYNVYRGIRSGGPYTKLNLTPLALTSYTDNAVQSGQTYFYVTTAIDSKNLETKHSTEVSAVIPIP